MPSKPAARCAARTSSPGSPLLSRQSAHCEGFQAETRGAGHDGHVLITLSKLEIASLARAPVGRENDPNFHSEANIIPFAARLALTRSSGLSAHDRCCPRSSHGHGSECSRRRGGGFSTLPRKTAVDRPRSGGGLVLPSRTSRATSVPSCKGIAAVPVSKALSGSPATGLIHARTTRVLDEKDLHVLLDDQSSDEDDEDGYRAQRLVGHSHRPDPAKATSWCGAPCDASPSCQCLNGTPRRTIRL